MWVCKSCKNETKYRLTKGLCHNCYMYFEVNHFNTWCKPRKGQIGYVNAENNPQYGMIVCHECGKAFTKLQQHIYYSHNMTKEEYCYKFGLDHKAQLTSRDYNEKMSNYANKYNMGEQLKEVGRNTRFEKGHTKSNYKRSEQTKERLRKQGIEIGNKYGSENGKKAQYRNSIIRYINSLDESIRKQTIDAINGPTELLTIDQLKLKCALLGYDLNKKIDFEV